MVERIESTDVLSVPESSGRVQLTEDPPEFVDLFAGCGGLSLGLLQSGWLGIGAVEKDAFAFSTLEANLIEGRECNQYMWPSNLKRGPMSISSFLRYIAGDAELFRSLKHLDLIAGGPPCQGFSFAGRRDHDDPRNRLFREYVRAVRVLRPSLLLIENVPGVMVGHGGRAIPFSEKIVSALRRHGYVCFAGVHRAAEFGVPQERPRFFLIGIDSNRYPACKDPQFQTEVGACIQFGREALLNRKNLTGKLPISSREALSDLETHGKTLQPCADAPRRFQLLYSESARSGNYQLALKNRSEVSMDSMRLALHSKPVRSKLASLIESCTRLRRLGVSLTKKERRVLKNKKHHVVVLDPECPSHTLTTLPDDLIHYSEPRILTVREYARLQSFPDWFVFRGKYTTGGHKRVKECPRYTQVGNAVAPFVAEAMGLALKILLQKLRDSGPEAHGRECKERNR